jgi:hypothetical protein
MFTLDVDVRAVVLHDGQLLLTRGAPDQPRFECIGSSFLLGKSLPGMIEQALRARLSLAASTTKLLYIVERFYTRESTDVHQISHFYLCELADAEQAAPSTLLDGTQDSDVALVKPQDLAEGALNPECLREVLVADAAEDFNVSPKLIVDNQLGEKSSTASGVFRV